MADKDKLKPLSKNMPKDGQVVLAIMKEMGITEYEPKTIVQLTEFVYRYGTTVLEEARIFANNSRQRSNNQTKLLELEDVRLALQLQGDNTFTMPPPRELLLECARNKNNTPLPLIKPSCGLRLPSDRHCLASQNYVLKTHIKKLNAKNPTFVSNKPTANIIKRTSNFNITKQTVSIPKQITKVISSQPQKTMLKPKIQITQNIQIQSSNGSTIITDALKRKRDDDDIDVL